MLFRTSNDECYSIYCIILLLDETLTCLTVLLAMEFGSDEYDVIIGMDVICNGDLAITKQDGKTTSSFRIPLEVEIDFSK